MPRLLISVDDETFRRLVGRAVDARRDARMRRAARRASAAPGRQSDQAALGVPGCDGAGSADRR